VEEGQRVEERQVIADDSPDEGAMALVKNLSFAFRPGEGHNYRGRDHLSQRPSPETS